MSASLTTPAACVGLAPWLPWPLSASPAWTVPVRAERLALLRIGVAFCLLLDITLQLAPFTRDFLGKHHLAQPRLVDGNFQPQHMNWSLLRGIGRDGLPFLSLIAWSLLTVWIFATDLARLRFTRPPVPPQDRTGFALALWTAAWCGCVTGMWSRLGDVPGVPAAESSRSDLFAWAVPLAGIGLVLLLAALELLLSFRLPEWRMPWAQLGCVALVHVSLLAGGLFLSHPDNRDPRLWWMLALGPWQQDDDLLILAMGLWIAAATLLMIGCFSRTMAVLTYLLTISFGHLNPYLDNSGDIIRNILLMYLMLCPCGAAWSVDAWRKRRRLPRSLPHEPAAQARDPLLAPRAREEKEPLPPRAREEKEPLPPGAREEKSRPHVFVQPWPIRLIFLQLIVIYFMNGLHKTGGEYWRTGLSLHYVLGDLSFARMPQTHLMLPLLLTRILTWTVLAWELSFPLLTAWKWTRPAALIFGVLFHLGTLVLMEISVFPLYAICMYLPLVPIGSSSLVQPSRPSKDASSSGGPNMAGSIGNGLGR